MLDPFDWDPVKNEQNKAKHGLSFEEAQLVFDDPYALDICDDIHSEDEDRWITLGLLPDARMIVVVYTDRGEDIRIISARFATPTEIKSYERESGR